MVTAPAAAIKRHKLSRSLRPIPIQRFVHLRPKSYFENNCFFFAPHSFIPFRNDFRPKASANNRPQPTHSLRKVLAAGNRRKRARIRHGKSCHQMVPSTRRPVGHVAAKHAKNRNTIRNRTFWNRHKSIVEVRPAIRSVTTRICGRRRRWVEAARCCHRFGRMPPIMVVASADPTFSSILVSFAKSKKKLYI